MYTHIQNIDRDMGTYIVRQIDRDRDTDIDIEIRSSIISLRIHIQICRSYTCDHTYAHGISQLMIPYSQFPDSDVAYSDTSDGPRNEQSGRLHGGRKHFCTDSEYISHRCLELLRSITASLGSRHHPCMQLHQYTRNVFSVVTEHQTASIMQNLFPLPHLRRH